MSAILPYDIRNMRGMQDTALDSGMPVPDMAEVEMGQEPGAFGMDGGVNITPGPDGGIVIDFAPSEAVSEGGDTSDHYANLAEYIDPTELANLGADICEGVEADIKSRDEWNQRLAKGLEVLGITIPSDADMGVLKVAKAIHHPLLAEALVQFQARAYAELFPPGGPAKATALGKRTKELEEQAQRVENFLNYQTTLQDRPYYEESDQLLFMLGLEGSQFRKVYQDPLLKRNVARWVRAENFVVPYSATSFETATRYTHILKETKNDVLKRMKAQYYKADPLEPPTDAGADRATLTVAKDEAEGKQPELRDEDAEYTTYECHTDRDIKGFEDLDFEGKPSGVALPYVVLVDKETQKVRAVFRNWKETDQEKTKRVWFSHYKYLPGTGFYGFGLLHTIGGLSNAATALLRLIVASAGFAGMQGGAKTRSGRGLPTNFTLEFGEYKEVDLTAEELAKVFWTPNFKEPGESLFRVLGLIQELAQRFASTTEAMVGDAKNTGPVGTTLALIEQGSKVATGIHKRCHIALGYELRLLADLNGEYTPEEGYPYDVVGDSKQVLKSDFSDKVDVSPVSDPNIFSSTQRIAMAQAELQLADSAPDLYNRREAHLRMLRALRVEDPESLLPDKARLHRCDPVTENALAMTGHPLKVFQDQNHDAHNAVHLGDLKIMVAQGSPSAQMFQQVILPHIAEHEAMAMRLKMMQAMGMQLPPVNLYAQPGDDEEEVVELPPEVENQIAVKAAGVMQQLLQQLAQAQQAATGGEGGAAADGAQEREQSAKDHAQGEEQDDAATGGEIKRKDAAAAAEQRRKDIALHAQVDRDDAKAGLDPASVKGAQQYLQQRGLDQKISPRALSVTSRALGKSFDDVVKAIMFMEKEGQGMGPSAMTRRDSGRPT